MTYKKRMTKKDILDVVKKTYKRTTGDIFNDGCHIFTISPVD